MTKKIWLAHYPAGIPAEIDPDVFTSIPDLVEKLAARYADRPAFHNLGTTLSYSTMERLSRAFAAFLRGLPNMARGDGVAIMSPNLLQYPVSLFGILRAGLTVVNVNPLYTPRELKFQLDDSGSRAIVLLENFANTLSVGLPFPSTDVSIRDDAFNELPAWTGKGEIEKHTGEICIRGPQVMKDYWNNPGETAKVMQDGWLKTGDVGRLNADGSVVVTDRKKDVIIVSGFSVYPNEVEEVIALHPGVRECGVVGVPDDRSGEAVKAVILKKDPNLTVDAVIRHCRTQLAPYKVPRHVEFRTTLPKTPIGKVLRRALNDDQKQ
ncbi:MAG: AMP-binding protein [Desulfobacterales bacterium]